MLDLMNNSNLTNFIIDGALEVIRQGKIQRSYSLDFQNRKRDINIDASIDWKNSIFSFDLNYRSYPKAN